MGDQSTNTSSLLVPDGFRSLDSDDDSEADSLHMESVEDITLPFSTHLPDFLPCLDTVTVTLGPEGCVKDNPCNELDANITDGPNGIDTSNLPPVTPTKPLDTPTALHPLTPTANLKLLMSAVSPEIRSMEKRQKSKALFNAIVQAASQENLELQQSIEYEVDVETSSQDDDYVDDGEKPANRKAKSLGLLCQRFLSKYPDYPVDGQAMEISLDAISKELCVERRRIYDIVNVLESVEMVQRQAKNKYLWHGKTYLIQTLVKLKCLGERNDYANQMERLKKLQVERDYQQEMSNGGSRSKKAPLKDFTNTAGQQMAGKRFLEDDPNARKDKSLGVMSQKFIMLFLVSKNQLVTLDIAARVLIGDINYEIVENSKFKTKVRRLYDIANILTSLRMIKKVHIHERRGRKPAFRWIGPNPDIADIDLSQYDLQSKPVFRHSHFPPPAATSTSVSSTSAYLAPIRPKSRGKKTASFTRHSSFNIMRKLTTGDADNRHCSSAPSSPAKMTVSKETNEKFQREFDNLRTKYPDCMSKLFAACNIEKERMQQQEHEQQLISVDDAAEDHDQFEVSDQLQTARKVLNLDDGEENMDKSQTADSEELVLSNMLTETVDSLNCALRDADKMRRSKRTIKQPMSDEYEYQPLVKRSKVEHQALAALQKYSDPSGQKTHITLQRVKTENLTKRVMSELTSKKQTDSEVGEELPPDLAMLQESVGMGKPAAPVTVEMRKLSAFVPVSTHAVEKGQVKLSYQNQDSHTKVVVKQLPVSTGHKPNLPLIRNPTKTIPIPQDFVKKLLCKEKLDEPTPDTKVSESIFISTKPVNPALVQTGKSPEPATDHSRKEIVKTSPPTVSTSSSMPKAATEPLTGASSMKPNLPPFQPISVENKHKRSPSPQTTSTQASSPCGTSPPFSRCSSLGSVGELDRTLSTDSQVSARCRSKSVSPNAQVIQAGNPIETSSRTLLINSKINVSVSSPINATTIPNTIQTCMITTAGATVATPVRLGLPMPITRMTTLIPGTSIPAVRQSSIGQFMSMSSVLPPYPAGHLPMPSTLCNTMHPCISTTTTCVPTTNHLVSPQYTSTSTPAGLITPTSSAQGTNDINFYRTPTTLPFGSVQPKAFFNSQALGMPTGTPYVLSGVGGAIGQLQPVSRRLTLALPPSSQH